MDNKFFKVKADGVSSEIFDSECVVINFELGNYYNGQGVATFIWQALQSGASYSDIVAKLANFYAQSESQQIQQDVKNFLQQLLEQRLIIDDAEISPLKFNLSLLPQQYLAPQLQTFNDLQELFLLDPVHAVDSKKGWPFKPEQNSNGD